MLSLKAKTREPKEDLELLRKEGMVPAVFYGAGNPTTHISVSLVEFKKAWQKAGESTTVKISTPKGDVDTLIHEVQTHPVTDEPIHIDFLAIDMNKKIQVGIPLEFIGVSNAVKGGLGTLVKVLYEVEVEALPKDLPHSIQVDIAKLEGVDSQILVSDIKAPQGVTIITPSVEVVASIAVQKEEKDEPAEPVDLSKIEVEKKGKKEEEGVDAPAAE
ncbi:MAG: 50S ribosomal protein L25 [Candidatus Pacebacteria bacterium]|nr:50S ribosomal protein L25 [Candidatus Paceibacterota bacterium]MBP9839694.1 50S ribosomal protein L25 [Candidatus Paceibacterota bacterium]MDQ5922673.1 large subunit ribosomal protein [Patescibacteria group bacterium]